MTEVTGDVSHLIDPTVTVSKVERPAHFTGLRLALEDLRAMAQDDSALEDASLAPVQILKAGLGLINGYNGPAAPIPEEVIAQFGLGNSEMSVRRAYAAKYVFESVLGILGLPPDHLSIDATKEYVEVHGGTKARSAIMPTHFRDGAQLFIPHDDYMYDLAPSELPRINIGSYTTIAQNVRMDVGSGLHIGDRVFIARGVHRIGHTHDKDFPGIARETMVASHVSQPLYLGDDVLVGYGAEISPATQHIGQNAIVGQKSVVTAPWLGEFSIVVGNNRTIGYLPSQAYFKSEYGDQTNVDLLARIDWKGAVRAEWRRRYQERLRQLNLDPKSSTRGHASTKTLVLGHTGEVGEWATLVAQGQVVDYVADDMREHPLLLQIAQDTNNSRLRVRTGIQPFLQSNYTTVYDRVIDNTKP